MVLQSKVMWDCAKELVAARERAPANPSTVMNFTKAAIIVSPVSRRTLLLICDLLRGDVEQGYTHGIHEGVFDDEQRLRIRSNMER
jgi:hypothetical protein